jgi:hypothetical protein
VLLVDDIFIDDINHPLHLLPVDIADCVEDLRFAMVDVNPKFDHVKTVQQAIKQAADLRKQAQAPSSAV